MHRLFVALRPPPTLRAACLAAMEDGPPGWAWQDEDQLHLTLRYIGEVDRPVAEDVASALGGVSAPAVDLLVNRGQRLGGATAGKQSAAPSLVEPADPVERKIDRRGADAAERARNILRQRPVDLTDVAQCQVKLVLVLPRPTWRPVLHRRQAGGAERWRRA